jgi:hypothetical protein
MRQTALYRSHARQGARSTGRRTGTPAVALEPQAAQATVLGAPCPDNLHTILNTALVAEQIATTFYYTALTSFGVMHNRELGGSSTDPNDPGLPPNGNPPHVRYLQAALDAELKHTQLLARAGAISPYGHFYFPPTTFATMGSTLDRASFLGVMDVLESIQMGVHIGASVAFIQLHRPDLALMSTQMMGVEAEHRTLGRVLANVVPANSLTLEQAPFACAADAMAALRPFLTGRRYLFAQNATRATPLPRPAQVRFVVGKHGTRQVRRFL